MEPCQINTRVTPLSATPPRTDTAPSPPTSASANQRAGPAEARTGDSIHAPSRRHTPLLTTTPTSEEYLSPPPPLPPITHPRNNPNTPAPYPRTVYSSGGTRPRDCPRAGHLHSSGTFRSRPTDSTTRTCGTSETPAGRATVHLLISIPFPLPPYTHTLSSHQASPWTGNLWPRFPPTG